MKKKKIIWIVLLLLVFGMVCSGILIFMKKSENTSKVAKGTEIITSFADITDYELLHDIPVLSSTKASLVTADDFGADTFGVRLDATSLEDYQEYLLQLQEAGFTKYVDNGEQGLEGYVYTEHYQKDKMVVVVTHLVKLNRTVISVSEKEELSPNLIYSEEYLAGNKESAQTTFHMPEMYEVGNSFVIQLKNGRFIVNDGGTGKELPYLMDYLDSLVPEGEKPIIEAWIFSHAHYDHVGAFNEIYKKQQYAKRVYVENIFFTDINDAELELGSADNMKTLITNMRLTTTLLKGTDGSVPKIYRLRTGERYYFNDITIDVVFTHDMFSADEWPTSNTSSTHLMYTIEGQKVFIPGDANWEDQLFVAQAYDSQYFNLTLYQVPHHGGNIWNEITDHYESITTVIYPNYRTGANGKAKDIQNNHIQSLAVEAYSWGDGTKVFTFPYQAGSVKSLPLAEWIYEAVPEPYRGN